MSWIDAILTYSLWGMGVIGFIVIITLFVFIRKYKHTVIIRKVVNNRVITRTTKARTWTDKDGSRWWKILKADTAIEKLLHHPPESALEMTEKGKLFAEAHQTESGEYHWICDDVNSHKFKTVPANQRIILANQIRKAEEEGHSLLQKHFKTFLIGGFVLMGLLLVLLFGGELLEPLTVMGDSFQATAVTLNEAISEYGEVQVKIAEIENKVQTLQDSSEFGDIGQGDTD